MPLLQMSVLDPPLSGLAKEGVKQPRGHAVGKRRVDEGKMRGWLNGRHAPWITPGVVSSAGVLTSRVVNYAPAMDVSDHLQQACSSLSFPETQEATNEATRQLGEPTATRVSTYAPWTLAT